MSAVSYKCPGCGGDLRFDPDTQECKCEYCLSSFTVPDLESRNNMEEVINDASKNTPDYSAEMVEYSCPSCGAVIVTDTTTSATFCIYCHNPVVIPQQVAGEFRPAKVIPFKLKREDAIDKLNAWCKKKWFLPRDFRSQKQLDMVKGVYLPYWLVDFNTKSQLSAEGRIVTSWRVGDYQYTKTDRYSVQRSADMALLNIPHDASSKADDKLMDSIEPFDYNETKDFSMSYLSGFLAEKYDVPSDQIIPVLKERATKVVHSELSGSLRSERPYTSVSERGFFVDFKSADACYALLPIWMVTYLYNGKTFMYVINGQTGKASGILPISRGKLALLFGIVAAVTFAAAWIGGTLLL